ncbi:MAG: molecular chaperone DnaK [Ferruginibacter sp.]
MAKIGINIATGSLQQEEIIVGIDLGTTNSLVAVIHPETKKPIALREHDGLTLVPSVIYFNETGNIVVGDEAKDFLITAPHRTIFSAKRLMGKSYGDVESHSNYFSYKIIDDKKEGLVKVQVGEKFYSPVDLSSFILKELKQRAEHILKTSVNRAVITVPAYFNDSQRQATRDAGKLAGLDVLRIINEPTAASLAYGIGMKAGENKTIAVYDLGGGTFDVSILQLSGGIFEVLSTNGDTYLGGDDLDKLIASNWIKKHNIDSNLLNTDKSFSQSIRLMAEEAKKYLSEHESYSGNHGQYNFTLTRNEFEDLIGPVVYRTIASCKAALKDAGLSTKEIDAVVMVGGSTRVPLIKQSISKFFGREVNDTVNPDEVVALGAAIQADILAGNNKDVLLLDITALSLGIETSGGLMDVLIPRNAKIPNKTSRQYTTQVDGQPGMRISIYQGERDLVKDNRKLGEFNLTGIPGMPAGLPKVEVSFMINADGILTVSAKELRSGVEQEIEVKPQYGLSDSEVEQMLLDSITHAKDDVSARALAEARAEGEQLLKTTERFLQKNTTLLSKEEILETANAMQALQMAITMEDKDLIQTKHELLNDISRPYAERIMDQAVSAAMKGKSI